MEWVLFDLNGTLLDPRAVGEPLSVEDGGALALAALDDAVGQAMADTLSGEFRPFPSYLESALRRRLELAGAPEDGVEAAMEQAKEMPPFADSAEALDTLKDAGLRVGVLTNSATDSAQQALEAAGLADRLDAVMGADEVEAYKPDRRVYAHGLERIGAAADETCLVAAHWWDIAGAHRAGLHTAWVAHKERSLLSTVPDPTARGETLADAARAIAARRAA